MEGLSQYLLSIVAAALISALAVTLTENNSVVSAVVKLLAGLFLSITVISPVTKWKLQDLGDYWDTMQMDASALIASGKNIAADEQAAIIKEQTEAYILDKADTLGLQLEVTVELTESDPPIPCSVSIKAPAAPYVRSVLQSFIEEELGIAKEQQSWN